MIEFASSKDQGQLLDALIANEKLVILITPSSGGMIYLGQLIWDRLKPDIEYLAFADGVFIYEPSRCSLDGEGYGILMVQFSNGLFCWCNQVPLTHPLPINKYKTILAEEIAKIIDAIGEHPHVH